MSKSVKENFVDGITFRNYLQEKLGRINDYDDNEIIKCHMNDLDFLDKTISLVKDNPKVIKLKELNEPKLLMKMKEYFVKYDEDLTKRNVRSYISGYNKFCFMSGNPLSYFFTNDEKDNLLIEWFENDLICPTCRKDISNDFYTNLKLILPPILKSFLYILKDYLFKLIYLRQRKRRGRSPPNVAYLFSLII